MATVLNNLWLRFRKELLLTAGLLVILVGLITTPLPTPIGLPLIVVGLVLVLRSSPRARRAYLKLRSHCRRGRGGYRKLLHGVLDRFEPWLRYRRHRAAGQRIERLEANKKCE